MFGKSIPLPNDSQPHFFATGSHGSRGHRATRVLNSFSRVALGRETSGSLLSQSQYPLRAIVTSTKFVKLIGFTKKELAPS
jgi:hypothetical protein